MGKELAMKRGQFGKVERGFSNEAYAKGRIAFQNTPNVIDVYSQPTMNHSKQKGPIEANRPTQRVSP